MRHRSSGSSGHQIHLTHFREQWRGTCSRCPRIGPLHKGPGGRPLCYWCLHGYQGPPLPPSPQPNPMKYGSAGRAAARIEMARPFKYRRRRKPPSTPQGQPRSKQKKDLPKLKKPPGLASAEQKKTGATPIVPLVPDQDFLQRRDVIEKARLLAEEQEKQRRGP